MSKIRTLLVQVLLTVCVVSAAGADTESLHSETGCLPGSASPSAAAPSSPVPAVLPSSVLTTEPIYASSCHATAHCGASGSVSCSGSSSCLGIDCNSSTGTRGHVLCDGQVTYCPVAPACEAACQSQLSACANSCPPRTPSCATACGRQYRFCMADCAC